MVSSHKKTPKTFGVVLWNANMSGSKRNRGQFPVLNAEKKSSRSTGNKQGGSGSRTAKKREAIKYEKRGKNNNRSAGS